MIIWDRLFGSFLDERDLEDHTSAAAAAAVAAATTADVDALAERPEESEEACLFGTMAVGSWINAVLQTTAWRPIARGLGALGKNGSSGALVQSLWRTIAVGPGYSTIAAARRPADGRHTAPERRLRLRSKLPPSSAARAYLLLHFATALLQFLALLLAGKQWPEPLKWGVAASVVAALATQGAMLDGASAAAELELGRASTMVAVALAGIYGDHETAGQREFLRMMCLGLAAVHGATVAAWVVGRHHWLLGGERAVVA
eukprot:COSAG06_NODE_5370_length_3520_cov_5.050570_2_plen_259_part_00